MISYSLLNPTISISRNMKTHLFINKNVMSNCYSLICTLLKRKNNLSEPINPHNNLIAKCSHFLACLHKKPIKMIWQEDKLKLNEKSKIVSKNFKLIWSETPTMKNTLPTLQFLLLSIKSLMNFQDWCKIQFKESQSLKISNPNGHKL